MPIIQTNNSFLQVFLDFLADKTSAENLIDIENDDGSIRHVRVSVTHFEADKQTGERAILMLLTDYTELLKVRSVLERYTSKEIAKAALEEHGGDSRRGRLVDATVLFCDIRGYTALSSEMQNCMSEVNACNEQQGITSYEIGIGINSGPMIAGNIGSNDAIVVRFTSKTMK